MEMTTQYTPSNMWNAMFTKLAEMMLIEPHLLPQKPEVLEKQFFTGLSAIAVEDGEIVGHATLWEIAPGWYEIGTTYVVPKRRKRHINVQLYEMLLSANLEKNILETTTNEISVRVGENLGFVPIKRTSLPPDTFVGACICKPHKIGSSDPLTCCNLAWNGDTWNPFEDWMMPCHVRVTPETLQRNPFLIQIQKYKVKELV